MNILDKIIEHKHRELGTLKRNTSLADFRDSPYFTRKCLSLAQNLGNIEQVNIIAEFKRRSPSKNQIASMAFSARKIAESYESNGAAGISILTDERFFGGSSLDLSGSRESIAVPILRKDFIIDPYQVYESKSMGADVILLIAAVLDRIQLRELMSCAHELGMETICELHGKRETELLDDELDIIGINNRNLKDFTVDFKHSAEMRKLLPANAICISESGISEPGAIAYLKKKGFNGFLIGESLMKEKNPGEALRHFIDQSKNKGHDH